MAGYLGTKAVLLSTTAADVTGDAEIGGDLTVGGNLTSTGIDDNASSTAITIDSSQNVGIGTSSPSQKLHIYEAGTGGAFIEIDNTQSGAATTIGKQGSSAYGATAAGEAAFYTYDNSISIMADGGAGNTASIKFSTGGNTERMRIDSSGNVGIGTSSPSAQDISANNLVVEDTAGNGGITIKTPTSAYGSLHFSDGTGVDAYRGALAYNHADNTMQFTTNATEAMRIDSSGNLLVGTTNSDPIAAQTDGISLGSDAIIRGSKLNVVAAALARRGTDGAVINFLKETTTVGTVSVTGSATSYNTSSDYRLKTDAQPMTGASARVQALKPVNFEWIADGTRVDGFLAHEAQEVVPEAVTGTKDAMRDEEYEVTPAVYEDVVIPAVLDDDGNELEAERTEQRLVTEAVMGTRSVPDYQGIDQSKLVPLLTAALQEALTKIDDMETRLAALEGN